MLRLALVIAMSMVMGLVVSFILAPIDTFKMLAEFAKRAWTSIK